MVVRVQQFASSEKLFFLSYGAMLFFGILSTSFFYRYFAGTPYKGLIVLCTLLPAVREAVIRHDFKKDLAGGLLCLTAFFLAARVRTSVSGLALAAMFAFVFYARTISFEKIAKFSIAVSSAAVALVILGACLGVIDHYILADTAEGMKLYRIGIDRLGEIPAIVAEASRVRAYLGFRYALYAPNFVSNITMLVVCWKKGELKWRQFAVLWLVNALFFVLCDARLSFALISAFLLCAAFLKKFPHALSALRFPGFLMTASFCICFIVSVQMTVHYDPSIAWMRTCNALLGRRLEFANLSLAKFGVSFWGQDVKWVGFGLDLYGQQSPDAYLYVDNLYIQMLQRFGAVFTGMILILYTAAAFQCWRQKRWEWLLCLFVIALHAMIDDLIISLHFNTFWLLVGILLFGTWKKEGGNRAR